MIIIICRRFVSVIDYLISQQNPVSISGLRIYLRTGSVFSLFYEFLTVYLVSYISFSRSPCPLSLQLQPGPASGPVCCPPWTSRPRTSLTKTWRAFYLAYWRPTLTIRSQNEAFSSILHLHATHNSTMFYIPHPLTVRCLLSVMCGHVLRRWRMRSVPCRIFPPPSCCHGWWSMWRSGCLIPRCARSLGRSMPSCSPPTESCMTRASSRGSRPAHWLWT